LAAVDDLDEVVEQYHLAADEFVKGNPEPAKELFSHREDVTLNNPFSLPAGGWEQVAETQERAAANFRELRRHVEVSVERVAEYVTTRCRNTSW
jgi:hypothetical protein